MSQHKALPILVSDDFGGGYKATEHLILQGCRRIAHFTGALSLNIYEDRLAGYKAALEKHGISYDPDLVFEFYLNTENSRKSARSLLSGQIKRSEEHTSEIQSLMHILYS